MTRTQRNFCFTLEKQKKCEPTFTLEALSVQAPQQTAAVVAEGGTLVVVGLEAMRHVNLEALLLELRTSTQPSTRAILSSL